MFRRLKKKQSLQVSLLLKIYKNLILKMSKLLKKANSYLELARFKKNFNCFIKYTTNVDFAVKTSIFFFKFVKQLSKFNTSKSYNFQQSKIKFYEAENNKFFEKNKIVYLKPKKSKKIVSHLKYKLLEKTEFEDIRYISANFYNSFLKLIKTAKEGMIIFFIKRLALFKKKPKKALLYFKNVLKNYIKEKNSSYRYAYKRSVLKFFNFFFMQIKQIPLLKIKLHFLLKFLFKSRTQKQFFLKRDLLEKRDKEIAIKFKFRF